MVGVVFVFVSQYVWISQHLFCISQEFCFGCLKTIGFLGEFCWFVFVCDFFGFVGDRAWISW